MSRSYYVSSDLYLIAQTSFSSYLKTKQNNAKHEKGIASYLFIKQTKEYFNIHMHMKWNSRFTFWLNEKSINLLPQSKSYNVVDEDDNLSGTTSRVSDALHYIKTLL